MDKLTIANIRLWNLEDQRRDWHNDIADIPEDRMKEFLAKVSGTNRERNNLIDQINAGLRVLVDKAASKNTTFELTADDLLGTGKNKFYSGEDK